MVDHFDFTEKLNDFEIGLTNTINISKKDSWVHRWEPRSKVVSCTILVFGLVCLESPKLLMASYLLLLVLLLTMGFSTKELIKKTSYLLPFIALMAIPLLLGGGIPPSHERKTLVLLLGFKALNSLYIMFLMFYSQPVVDLLNGLSYMKLPGPFISVVFLSWRYIYLLGDRLSKLYKALLSRLFNPRIRQNSLKTYGAVMGGMLIKSIDTSDQVYKAMSSRGFNGTMPRSTPKEIRLSDIIKSVMMVLAVILLNIFEKWWY